jgi:hypothetical protein
MPRGDIVGFIDLYNDFIKLDPAYKFYCTLVFGGVVFLYKTFYSICFEEDKQLLTMKIKAAEVIAKLEAAIALYEKSEKDKGSEDKLIEKMGECWPYLEWEVKQKIRLYYSNRSESTLMTLKKIISSHLDTFGTPGKQGQLLDQMFAYISKMYKPIFPLIGTIILLFFAFTGFLSFTQSDTIWGKIEVFGKYCAILFSVLIAFTYIEVIFQRGTKRRNKLKITIYSLAIILTPFLFLIIYSDLIVGAFLIQIIVTIIFVKSK